MKRKTRSSCSQYIQLFCAGMHSGYPVLGPQNRIPFSKVPSVSQTENLATIHLWDVQLREGLLPPTAEEIA